jgi:mono/diheme cytochrome c family protein
VELRRSAVNRRRAFLVLLVALTAGACTREQWHRFPSPDDVVALVPWFSVMHKGIAIQPYKMPLQPVEGTVPIGGVEHVPPAVPQNQTALDRLENPMAMTAASLERGKERYDIYCTVCHGADGAGDGPVAYALANAVRNLNDQRVLDATDGWIYGVIVNGYGALMPGYGARITTEDRWHIVNYVRSIQGATR